MIKPYYQDDDFTIYCGDCRGILPHLDRVDLVLTDPPYGHNNNNNGDLIQNWEKALGRKAIAGEDKPRPIANDGPEANTLVRWAFTEFARLLGAGCCCCCCCGGGGPDPQFARWSLWLDECIPFKQMVVWDKGPMGMGWHYRRSYETILVAQQPGKCKWYDTTNKIENIIRPSHGFAPKLIPSETDHPTPKPVELMAYFIGLHTDGDDVVLDPFMGHGTTLRAAKDLGRKAIGIEIEERYCEIAVNRLRQGVLF